MQPSVAQPNDGLGSLDLEGRVLRLMGEETALLPFSTDNILAAFVPVGGGRVLNTARAFHECCYITRCSEVIRCGAMPRARSGVHIQDDAASDHSSLGCRGT